MKLEEAYDFAIAENTKLYGALLDAIALMDQDRQARDLATNPDWKRDFLEAHGIPHEPPVTDLTPCPFCGGHPYRSQSLREGYENDREDPDAIAYFVRCNSCAAQGGWAKSKTGGDRLWRTRRKQEHVSMIQAGMPQ